MKELDFASRTPLRWPSAKPIGARSVRTGLGLIAVALLATAFSSFGGPCPCTPEPVGWWQAEGDVLDFIGPNDGGTLEGGATFGTGFVGSQAFSLDGVDDHVSIPDDPSLRPVNLTIEGWFNFASVSGVRLLVSKTVGISVFDSYQISLNAGSLGASVADSSAFGEFVTAPFAPTLGVWYHIAYTYNDATDSQALYIDGALVGSGAATKTIGYDTHPLIIGANIESEVLDFFFEGLIDEVSIYNQALTAADVLAIFNAGATGKDKAPPVITCPADITAVCDTYTDTGITGLAAATDDCDPAPVVTSTDSVVGGLCQGSFVVTRTWTATDCMGKTDMCVQTITVATTEATAPVVTCPADVTVSCDQSIDPGDTGSATAVDNCDPAPVVTFSDAVAGDPCPGASVITRTWTAQDCSGNIDTCIQTLTLTPLTDPCNLPRPLSWWRAEGNAEDSLGANDGTLIGGTTFGAGQVAQAFSLDGVDDYVRIPDAPSLRPTSLTLEGWFNFSSASGTRVLIGKAVGAGFFNSYQIVLNNGFLQGAIGDAAGFGPPLDAGFTPTLGQWYHIAYTFDDATDAQALYLDGALLLSGSVPKVIGYDDHPVLFGADLESNVPALFFSGLIDEVAIHDSALSAFEIAALHAIGGAGRDQTPPVITCPADFTADCSNWTDTGVTGVPTVTDDCDTTPTVSFTDSVPGGPCVGTLAVTRTWSATDDWGNTATCQQTVTINTAEATPPVVVCPANITVSCAAGTDPSNTGSATATDNCDPNPAVTFSDVLVGDPCPGGSVITRTWTATDCSGNVAMCNQTITVVGLPDPCNLPTPVSLWKAEGTAADTADGNHGTLVNGTTFATGQAGQGFSLDGVNDYVSIPDAPSLRPANLTLEGWFNFTSATSTRVLIAKALGSGVLNSYQLLMNAGVLQGFVGDNAGLSASVNFAFAPTLGQWYHIVYTFDDAADTHTLYIDGALVASAATTKSIAYDANPVTFGADLENTIPSFFFNGRIDEVAIYGQAVNGGQVLALFNAAGVGRDSTPPVITCPADFTANCATFTDTGLTGVATATDDCDPSPTITFTDASAGGPCSGTLVITRTWTATDSLGNTATCQQTVTVNTADTTDPILVCPPSVAVLCGGATDPSATGSASATDNCDPNPIVTFSDAVAGDACPGTSIITRTWTATDCSGNVKTCQQTISVVGLMAACGLSSTVSWWKAEGNADDAVDGNNGNLINGTTFAAGQVGQAFSLDGVNDYVSILDSPSLRPVNLTIEGWFNFSATGGTTIMVAKPLGSGFLDSYQLWLTPDSLQGAVADGAGFGTFLVHPFVPTIGQWYHIAYTFNDAANSQALYVNGALVISGTVTKSIGYDSSPVLLGGDFELTVPDLFMAGLIDEVSIRSDALSAEEVEAIFQAGSLGKDDLPPTITCPVDVTIECGESLDPANTGLATASDVHGTPIVVFADTLAADCGNSGVITRAWSAIDDCGNMVGCVQLITLVDSTPPSITCPPNLTVVCGDSLDPADVGMPVGNDNCGPLTAAFTDSFNASCTGPSILSRVWTVTDGCGSSVSCTQTITVNNPTGPGIVCAADVTVECGDSTDPADTGLTIGTHACDTVTVTSDDSFVAGCGASGVITRTWTVTDSCANQISCVQTITVVDGTDTSIACPADVTVECGASTAPAATGMATGTDACGAVTLTSSDTFAAACGNSGVITRTWMATDECGNQATCAQTITVVDTTDPTITCPVDVTVACGDSTAPAATGMATGTDTCGAVTFASADTVVAGCGTSGVITRTWTATDACGNDITCVQTISVVDATNPSITCPADATVECTDPTDPGTLGMATGSDTCGGVTITSSDNFTPLCGSSGTLSRTWVATDDCGNTSMCVQTITVQDTQLPSVICPADLTLTCGDSTDPADTGTATGSDVCGTATISFVDVFTPDCAGAVILTRTWTATDECGLTADCVQTVTISGSGAPNILCPADVTLGCGDSTDPADTGMATGSHDCDSVTVTFADVFAQDCGSAGVITRTWTATDGCANEVTCVQTLTIVDTVDPTITCPANVTVECGSSIAPAATGMPTASDNCGVSTSFADVVTSTGCGDTRTINRTWTATDDCGHTATCVQTISVVDTTLPMITCPPNVTVACGAPTNPAITGIATRSDNCGSTVLTFVDTRTTTCGNTFVMLRNWKATDACGNSVTCVQTVTVMDTVAPTITSCPANVTLNCGDSTAPANTGVATGVDSCGAVTADFTDSFMPDCAGTTVVTRTWKISDACGNMATCVQTLTVVGAGAPSILCPANVTVECGASTDPAATGMATGTHDCDSVTVAFTDVFAPGCGNSGVITRTWTATDGCANVVSCVQTVTIADTTNPSITCPANLTVECGESIAPAATGTATGSDTCGAVTITFADGSVGNCGNNGVITRTWTATDACGNTATCVQTLTVVDGTNPTISCPANVTLACGASTAPAATGMATGVDDCGSVTITFADVLAATCGNSGVRTRTWTATDECGNTSTCVQTITTVDSTNPVITCPANRTVECGGSTAPAATGTATATDNCGTVTVTFANTFVVNCGNTRVITRTWTATDQCGRTANCAQTITVRDTTPPTINCPANVSVDCTDPITPATLGMATASDLCGAVTVTFADTFVADCAGSGVRTRRWTATDACGNTAFCDQIITVVGSATPSIICPANVTVECGGSINPTATGMATGSHACDTVTVTFSDSLAAACGNSGVIARTWTATDSCANQVSCVQTITLTDTVAPTITCPADTTVECTGPATPAQTGMATATDNCGGATVGFSDSLAAACGNSGVIARTWTATDPCGNQSTCVQTITLLDTTAPSITCPANVTVECGSPTAPANVGMATGSDTCGTVTVSFADTPAGDCGSFTRLWTATDACGNVNTCTQIVTIVDTTIPTINCPAALTLACGASVDPTDTGMATGSDACGTLTIEFADDYMPDCAGTVVLTRTWSALDTCGNVATCDQVITLIGADTPSITCPPDVTLECSASRDPSNAGMVTAAHGCDSVTVDFSDTLTPTGCGGRGTIERAWTATDSCGNVVGCVQTITLVDTMGPDLVCPPDVTVGCTAPTAPSSTGTPTATDCGTATTSFADTVVNSGCGNNRVITRTWTATDPCGNTSTCVQKVTVADLTPPTIVCSPDVTVECGASTSPVFTGIPTGSDNCGSVSFTFANTTTLTCGNTRTITRTWTATDVCGNRSTCVQIITVADTVAPSITCPASVTVACGDSKLPAVTGMPTGSDTCGTVSFSFSDVFVPNCAGGTALLTRTWTATDSCGNIATCAQTITVTGSSTPSIVCPANVTVACSDSTDPAETGLALGSHDCDTVTVTFSDAFAPACGNSGVITRTWTGRDGCNNTVTCVQTITVVDTAALSITCPSAVTVQCNTSTAPAATGMATAVDNCGTATVTFADVLAGACGNSGVITRTWTATDACNNMASCVQLITIVNANPVISCPANLTLECGDSTAPADTGQATATDDCGTVAVTFVDVLTAGCGNSGVITRTWTATDECANTSTCVQLITLTDTTSPAISSCPANLTLTCGASTAPASTGMPVATDTCGTATVAFADSLAATCGSSGVITRTWTATDACGNTANCTQTITLVDTVNPVIVCPANAAPACNQSTDPASTGMATATDNCGTATVTFVDEVAGPCANTKTITRTWTATDACGNTASCVQTITVEDNLAPSISCPPNLTLVCGDPTDPASTGTATGSDACGTVTVVFADSRMPDCAGAVVLTRTWTATDECGNSSECVQTISVGGVGVPVISCPANMTLTCGESTEPANTGRATTTGDCNTAAITFSDSIATDCGNSITRTWTATDGCGTVVTCVQTISIADTTAPSVVCPADLTLVCGAPTDPTDTGLATATDLCGSVVLSFADSFTPICGNSVVIIRTWTATDGCNNEASCAQTITVLDTTAPVITCPADVTLDCSASVDPANTGTAVATDDCGNAIVSFSDSGSPVCGTTITRTWTATDTCGNTANCVQTITLGVELTNDDFVDRFTLVGTVAHATGSNLNSTKEAGEPDHGGVGGRSLWWTWTAPASGNVVIGTAGSGFDTLLAVYTGTSVSALTPVASNNDFNDQTSQVAFDAVAGTTYQIAVDGFELASGDFQLTLSVEGASRLEARLLAPDGVVEIELIGQPNATYFIDMSTDASNWSLFLSLPNFSGSASFTIPDVAPLSFRFYRGRRQ